MKKGLGRGLGALIKDGTSQTASETRTGTPKIRIDQIKKNSWQPRRRFEQEPLDELTQSIMENGILQPLLVRPSDGGYELIAGERRLRAAKQAGLKEVPATLIEASDSHSLELALVENLQRENLDPIEEAESYQLLSNKFNMTQEEIAKRVGKARASITNSLRILSLPDEIRNMISQGLLSAGHAKILTGLTIDKEKILYARRVVSEDLSVRNLEKLLTSTKRQRKTTRTVKVDILDTHMKDLLDKLHTHFGTNVRITPCVTMANGKKRKGRIEIDFYSTDDLDRLLELLGITGE